MATYYKLEIMLNEDAECKRAPYFACLLSRTDNSNWHNEYHDWASSHEEAFQKVYAFYQHIKMIKENGNEAT